MMRVELVGIAFLAGFHGSSRRAFARVSNSGPG